MKIGDAPLVMNLGVQLEGLSALLGSAVSANNPPNVQCNLQWKDAYGNTEATTIEVPWGSIHALATHRVCAIHEQLKELGVDPNE